MQAEAQLSNNDPYGYSALCKVYLDTHVATREPVVTGLTGASFEQLAIANELWPDYVPNNVWWPQDLQPPLGQYQSYDSSVPEILTADFARKVVVAQRVVYSWTPEEIRAWQLSKPRMVSMRGLHYRFTDDERVALAEAMADKPGATAEEQHAITTARVLHDAVFWDRYGLTQVDLNHPGFRASVQKMETEGLIAPGRADQILWIDPLPHETE